jgi:hypothetical protein
MGGIVREFRVPPHGQRDKPSRHQPGDEALGASAFGVVIRFGSYDNYASAWCRRQCPKSGTQAMGIIFDYIREDTFWKILLFIHFLLAVSLLAAVTLQAVAVLMPSPQAAGVAGNVVDRFSPVPAASYTTMIVVLYLLQALMGAWVYVKYRTYVRIPMEQLRHFWMVGSFELKEHVVTMGLGLLPAYWYFWQQPLSAEHSVMRKWVTVFLALSVWYAFLVGHVANDFRGVGS